MQDCESYAMDNYCDCEIFFERLKDVLNGELVVSSSYENGVLTLTMNSGRVLHGTDII